MSPERARFHCSSDHDVSVTSFLVLIRLFFSFLFLRFEFLSVFRNTTAVINAISIAVLVLLPRKFQTTYRAGHIMESNAPSPISKTSREEIL
jgi:hypothetical protein